MTMTSPLNHLQFFFALMIAFLLGVLLSSYQSSLITSSTNVNSDYGTFRPDRLHYPVKSDNNRTRGSQLFRYIDIDETMPSIEYLYKKLVIVTAFSQNHFKEAQGIIGTAQKKMPDKRIIVYDLGLNALDRKVVESYCNVELRDFPFSDYPEFVSNLLVYSWKPIIINITLNEFGAIYWGDASVRFKKSLKILLPEAKRHHGYMALIHSFDPKVTSEIAHQYFYTHPGMFTFMGINRTAYYSETNASPHLTANRQLIVNSSTVQNKIVQPLVDCALNLDCIAPKGSVKGEHRFDASALALIVYKNLKYEWTPENNNNSIFNEVIDIERKSGEKYHPKTCN